MDESELAQKREEWAAAKERAAIARMRAADAQAQVNARALLENQWLMAHLDGEAQVLFGRWVGGASLEEREKMHARACAVLNLKHRLIAEAEQVLEGDPDGAA